MADLSKRLPGPRARAVLVLVGLAFIAVESLCVPVSSSPAAAALSMVASERSDPNTFARVVARMRSGERYYLAMGLELRAGDYPTGSVFNWRTPLLYSGLDLFGPRVGLVIMAVLAAGLVLGLMAFLARRAPPEATVIGLILSASASATLADPRGLWMTEAWSGLFIGLSLAAYLWAAWVPAAVCGLIALFVRELAAPWCVVAVGLALQGKRQRELRVWAAGLAAFVVYYGVHVLRVLAEIGPSDPVHVRSWIQFGGLGFWLGTLKINKALFASPRIFLAICGALLIAGLWARDSPGHVRWSVVAYSLFFLAAGQSFNDYWGFAAAIPCALGVSYGPAGVASLIRRAVADRPRLGAA